MSDGQFFSDDDEISEQYVNWTQDALLRLSELVELLVACGGRDIGAVDEIYELSHNIKGMGSSFGFTLMTEVGASLCDYIKKWKTLNRESVDALTVDAHIKSFNVILAYRIKGDGGDKGRAVMTRLEQLVGDALKPEQT